MPSMNDTMEREKVTLSNSDRCDRCGARAMAQALFYVVDREGGRSSMTALLFCGHHFDKHRETLNLQAMRVFDTREG